MNKAVSTKESPITTFRTELMGIASIGILITHSTTIIHSDGIVTMVLCHGGIGVYMFVFLSAMGLFYSMKKQPDLKTFYRKRIQRVLIPFLFFSVIWYTIKDFMIGHDPVGFLLDISTLRFWMQHEGAWFVAFLLPVYIVFPYYFKWMERGHRTFKTGFIILMDLVVQELLWCLLPDMFEHLSQVLQSVWVFALGYHCAQEIHEKGSHCWYTLIPFVPLYLIGLNNQVQSIIPLDAVLYAYKGVVLLVLAAEILSCTASIALFQPVFKVFALLGGMTLEIYLTNDYLISASKLFHWENYIPNDIISYMLIVVVGLSVSYLFSTLYKTRFINRMEKSRR